MSMTISGNIQSNIYMVNVNIWFVVLIGDVLVLSIKSDTSEELSLPTGSIGKRT